MMPARRARPAWNTTCGFGMVRYSPRNEATSLRLQRMRPSARAAKSTIPAGISARRRAGRRPSAVARIGKAALVQPVEECRAELRAARRAKADGIREARLERH